MTVPAAASQRLIQNSRLAQGTLYRALIGQSEATCMAQHVRVGQQGQGSGGAIFLQKQVTVERCNGLRCSLTKNALPVGFRALTYDGGAGA